MSSQKEADTKLILHGHKILKEGSSKAAIYSPSGDTDILPLTLAHLYKCKERIYMINSHGQYKKHRLSSIFLEDEIIKPLTGFHAFTGNNYISSFHRTGKAACFKIFQGSPKFQSKLTGISDDLLTKLDEFVCHIYSMRKKM